MKKRQVVYRALVLVAVLILIALFNNFRLQVAAYRQKRVLESTFREYAQDLVSRNYTAAYAYGDRAFKEALDPQAFAAQQQALESRFGVLKSVRESGFDMHGRGSPMEWTAAVAETREYEKREVHITNEFHFENGRWQLFGYERTD